MQSREIAWSTTRGAACWKGLIRRGSLDRRGACSDRVSKGPLSRLVVGLPHLEDSGHKNHPRFRPRFLAILAEMSGLVPFSPAQVTEILATQITEPQRSLKIRVASTHFFVLTGYLLQEGWVNLASSCCQGYCHGMSNSYASARSCPQDFNLLKMLCILLAGRIRDH